MRIDLSPEQVAFIGQAIKNGRVASVENAVQEALQLWEKREGCRSEILAAVHKAEVSLSCGQGMVMTEESMRNLVEEVKRQGRTRLDADR
jgi:Arc/MetJ-type ribon-helix-helix transcriptional regulator